MAGREAISIPLELPPDEAQAFGRFASGTVTCGKGSECDVMWSAVCMLKCQLAEAGDAP